MQVFVKWNSALAILKVKGNHFYETIQIKLAAERVNSINSNL